MITRNEMNNKKSKRRLPAEWERQGGVQLTWPHAESDWAPYLDDITRTFIQLAKAIARFEPVLIVVPDDEHIRSLQTQLPERNIIFVPCPSNDTWARDHAFITVEECDEANAGKTFRLLDFCFNGWGDKFPAALDNAINKRLFDSGVFNGAYENHLDFVLEGGSIESDGRGTIYTTRCCLMAPNRNQPLTEQEIEEELKRRLCADRIVWLDDEPLPGDDTDGHIDTIARITPDGTLLRLPLPDPILDEDGTQLPATYANYLIINGAVLIPTYNQPENDQRAIRLIQAAFPDREMVPIDSSSIIKQHGSIHCCTMQYY